MSCLLWHQPNNRYSQVGDPLYNVCSECKAEATRLVENTENAVRVDKDTKDARQNPSSNYAVSKLSPASRSVRVKRLKKERNTFREKMNKFLEKTSEQLCFC